MKPKRLIITQLALCLCIFGQTLFAQTTAFSYQGSLKNSGSPANGNYDLEIKLFDAVSGGTQIGLTQQKLNVSVANGIFVVSMDFGAAALPGADRYLEIGVRVNGSGGGFQQLLPRQQVISTPYAVRSLNATSADSVATAGIPSGSGNYIQNTTSPQATSNFNISGNGIVGGTLSGNAINATTQYNIGGIRIFSANGSFSVSPNIFTATNTFAGEMAGINTAPDPAPAGANGKFNSFYGAAAGKSNTTGYGNSFFGAQAGSSDITGSFNSFFGQQAGFNNTLGGNNSFFGAQAGYNTSFGGNNNSFFGNNAGYSNMSGTNNTTIGSNADVTTGSLSNASAIGAYAAVGASNSLVLGSINGLNGASANTNVGIGTTTPVANLHVQNGGSNTARIQVGGTAVGSEDKLITFGDSLCAGWPSCVYIGERSFDDRMELRAGLFYFLNGPVQLANFSTAGSTSLCVNASSQISLCSSSLRYKTNIGQFSQGMSFVNKLRPISFDWKDGGMKDVGFGAEDVAKIDPRFVTYNDKGEVEGVKYDRLSVAFVNAFKEQQTQIAEQRERISSQQSQIDELKLIVCSLKPEAAVCAPLGK